MGSLLHIWQSWHGRTIGSGCQYPQICFPRGYAGLTLWQVGVFQNFLLVGRRYEELVGRSYCGLWNDLVCALRMAHLLWQGIKVDEYVDRIGIAVLAIRFCVAQLILAQHSLSRVID